MIEDVIDRVRTNLRANGCPAQVDVGPQFLAQHGAPPRVVFVPGDGDDAFEPPLAIDVRAGANPAVTPYQNPRNIARRWAAATVHIWGAALLQNQGAQQNNADRAALGALIDATIVALHYAAGFSQYRLLGGNVDTKTKLIEYGLLYTLRIQVAIPVLEIPWVDNAPYGSSAATRTGNTWTNLGGVKPKINESFDPSGNPVTVIEP